MLQRQVHAPASVYALADHLDGVLAACEDLLELNGHHADMEWFLASVRRFELAAILEVLRVRQHAEELRSADTRLAAASTLFLAGTLAVTQASGGGLSQAFDTPAQKAEDRHSFIITDDFMIGRRIPLGALAEMAAAFLDALEVIYVLYDGDLPRAARAGPARSKPTSAGGPPPLPMARLAVNNARNL
jgi:hypothetical protein